MKFLEKLQKLDHPKKRTILFSVTIILAICFFLIWIKLTTWRLSGMTKDQLMNGITLPNINLPKVEIPTIPNNMTEDATF
jgi:hypothetical protein